MAVNRWVLGDYTFVRNPDRAGGDTYWVRSLRHEQINFVGSTVPSVQIGGFDGATRVLKFTAIAGSMMRELETLYYARNIIDTCWDHLYYPGDPGSSVTEPFQCLIIDFSAVFRPVLATASVGDGEDSWDVTMTILKMD